MVKKPEWIHFIPFYHLHPYEDPLKSLAKAKRLFKEERLPFWDQFVQLQVYFKLFWTHCLYVCWLVYSFGFISHVLRRSSRLLCSISKIDYTYNITYLNLELYFKVLLGSTFFLRLCRCCCPSWVFPSRSGKARGLRERERGVLGYLNGSVSLESRPLRTEQSDRERMRPVEWMLLTPIIVMSPEEEDLICVTSGLQKSDWNLVSLYGEKRSVAEKEENFKDGTNS